MMKRNKLYTVNRYNKPLFMPEENLYPDGGDVWNQLAFKKDPLGYMSAASQGFDPAAIYKKSKNWLGISKENNPFSKGNLSGVDKAVGNAGLSIGAGLVGSIGGNLISGGLQSEAGSAISNIGGTIGGAVGAVNPVAGAILGAGSQILGGVTNALFGTSVDSAKLNRVNEDIARLSNFTSNAGSFDEIQGPQAASLDTSAYSGGVFSSASARRKNRELKKKLIAANQFALRSVDNNINNLVDNQMNDALANYAAFGGPIDTSMDGAIGYGFMSDYINTKKKNADNKNQMNNLFMGTPSSMFAFGGDMQTNYGDYPTGLTHVDAGGSHEESPYDGVQMGVDQEGTPNLVEEGETVYDNYVFSNRILADEATKQLFHLPKKRDITFADISKRLEKEITERPNDPISQAGFQAQIQTLEEQQERQKQEMEAERARAAFEALSPEEQTAVMQNAAQQEAMTEQAAMQQPSPEEIAMVQQQQAMADGSEAMIGQEPQMNCFGGRINRFDNGGQAYTKMLNSLGFHTQKEFDDWARENSIDFGDIWKDNPNTLSIDILGKLWSNEKFKEALKKKNPALAHAFETKGYDFGAYKPSENSKATIKSISKGNWKATNGAGWLGSDDPAWLEATKGMSEDDIKKLSTEDVAKLMRATTSYKKGTEWLQNKDNALLYLKTLMNDADTPQVAKDYAAKFVKDGQWKDGFNYDYATVFGSNGKGVRETNPGTYWHTPVEATRGAQAQNWVINDDGSVEEIIGEVPTDWTAAGNYSWATPENDMTYNYYRRPATAAPVSPETPTTKTPEEEGSDITPVRKWDGLRYAGLFGPAVGLSMQMAGIGKPDYSDLNAAVSSAGNYREASWMPRGDFAIYRPDDPWFYTSPIIAQSNSTQRAITNKVSPSKGAELLANSYNTIIGLGNAQRQASEHNFDKYMKVKQYNADIYKDNQREYGTNSRFNAGSYNEAAGRSVNARLNATQQKLANDAGWYNSLYGNVSGLLKGISDLGRENRETNWRNALVTAGAFGAMDEDALVNAGIAKYKRGRKSSEGGTVKRKKGKRGLTY